MDNLLCSLNDLQGFWHIVHMQLCLLWSYTIQTHVINYEDEWIPPACQQASSCDWEWDILDMMASRIIALQLALDLQAHWLTLVQLNRPQPWMSPSSLTPVHWLLQGPRQILWWVIKPNCLYGWLAPRSWMTNNTVPLLLHPLLSSLSNSAPLRMLERCV